MLPVWSFPPQLLHACITTGSYVAAFVEVSRVAAHRMSGPWPLEAPVVHRLLAVAAEEIPEELVGLLGKPSALDPRLTHVLDRLATTERLDDLAAEVGLSPSRLRALTPC
ncbi:hypothetical protein [Nonomuraea helvata]|uniref:hypothetical protein n=1 Tax=Nonomuraea helvata TaxID=37484 RepID=UPI0031E60BEF